MTKHQPKESNERGAREVPNREDADTSTFQQFAAERRPRKRNVNVEKVERGPRPEGATAAPRRDLKEERFHQRHPREGFAGRESRPYPSREGGEGRPWQPRGQFPSGEGYQHPSREGGAGRPYDGARRSFNPNFDRDNRPVGVMRPDRQQGGSDARRTPSRGAKQYGAAGTRPYPAKGANKGTGKGRKGAAPRYDKDNYPRFDAPPATGPVRLNRYIATSGTCSRREADDLIASGTVSVNGLVVTEMGYKVNPGDEVRLGEQRLMGEKKVYILMNKPKGFVATMEDPHAERTVIDLVKGQCKERVYPVGRLDKNSLGVLLITNDGDLTKRLTHPSYDKKKIYQASLDKALTRADMEKIAAGIALEDGPIAADAIDWVSESKKEVGIEVHSGRNRLVRRIFESLGYQVLKLDRVYFAGLTKQRLKRGAWRFLSPKEVGILKSGGYE